MADYYFIMFVSSLAFTWAYPHLIHMLRARAIPLFPHGSFAYCGHAIRQNNCCVVLTSYVEGKRVWTCSCLVMGTFLFSHVKQWHQEELLCLFPFWGCVAYCGRLMSFLMALQNSLDLSYYLISALVSWSQKEGAINVPLILTLVRRCLSVFIVVSLHCNPRIRTQDLRILSSPP